MTAAAAARRTVAVGVLEQRQALLEAPVRSSSRRASGSSIVMAEVSSSNRRTQAPAPADRLLGEDPLLGLGQQVVAVAAHGAQVVGAEVEHGVGEHVLDAVVVDRGPLELDEQRAWWRSPWPAPAPSSSGAPRSGSAVSVGEPQAGVVAGPTPTVLELGRRVASARPARRRRASATRPRYPAISSAMASAWSSSSSTVDRSTSGVEVPGDVGGGEIGVGAVGGGVAAHGRQVTSRGAVQKSAGCCCGGSTATGRTRQQGCTPRGVGWCA